MSTTKPYRQAINHYPEKKPKGQPLSDEAKIYTGRAHASLRILVVEQGDREGQNI
jgi:hypothetical protein